MSVRNLDALFRPRAVALLGASTVEHSIGAVLARNLMESGFDGPILPVDPARRVIRSVLTYPGVADLPVTPDLAVIATPPEAVPGLIDDLGRRGCRAAIVVTAGFGEDGGSAGRALRQAMLDAARPHLLRIVGPNGLGVISPHTGINASYAHRAPKPGNIAFLTQSGLIATSVLDWASERGIGFSHIVSLGAMSDVDFGDLLDVLESDPQTRIILLYVEAITEARKFLSAARIAARTKPVVVVKAGRTAEGALAAMAHSGVLAGADAVYDAAFRRAGMLRVETLGELFQAVATLSSGLRVRGDRLAVLTNGGGIGVMAADSVARTGGRLAELPEATLQALGKMLPKGTLATHPVDILGDADGLRYAAATAALLDSGAADAVLVLNCPTALADSLAAAEAVAEVAGKRRKPVLTCWLGGESAGAARRIFDAAKVATYTTPERAVQAFVQLDDYRRNQDLLMETPGDTADLLALDRPRAEAIIADARSAGRMVLDGPAALALLAAYGIPTVETVVAADADAACLAAEAIGYPVVLKIRSSEIHQKSDVGGVHLAIGSAAVLRQAVADMLAAVQVRASGASVDGFLVQPMIRRGETRELSLGISEDAVFGSVILFGEGGTAAEVIGDRVVGLPPLNDVLARDMIARTRVSRLFDGHGGGAPVNRDAVALTLEKLSHIASDLGDVMALEINPLIAGPDGVLVLDARILLRPVGGLRPPAAIHPYPRELSHSARTGKGIAYAIRPIRPEDEAAIVAMLQASSQDDIRLRFFAPRSDFSHAFAARLTQVDYDREMAFVATAESAAEISGVVRLIADPDGEAGEFAVMVRSDLKGTGLGSLLMSEILAYAGKRGIVTVHGEVLRENTQMLKMVKRMGFVARTKADDATVIVVERSTPPA